VRFWVGDDRLGGGAVSRPRVQAGSTQVEDDAHRCELNTALQIALDDPNALQGWLDGVDTLAATRAVVRYEGEVTPK